MSLDNCSFFQELLESNRLAMWFDQPQLSIARTNRLEPVNRSRQIAPDNCSFSQELPETNRLAR